MCLLALAWRAAPGYPLLLAAWWTDRPNVFGGRDLVAHGGWLAVDRRGRLAAVTNFRDPTAAPAPRSRGALVADFLAGSGTAAEFAAYAAREGGEYGPFNLLLYDGAELHFATNRGAGARLEPGVHVLTNAALHNDWPKAQTARAGVESLLQEPAPVEGLFELLARRADEDAENPYRSAHFIDGQIYGTKSSTVVTIDTRGTLTFVERSFDAAAGLTGEVRESFAAPASDGEPR